MAGRSLHAWEDAKENVLPLHRGRKPDSLVMPSMEQDGRVNEMDSHYKRKIISAQNSPDPLSAWISYIKWIQDTNPAGTKGKLEKVLADCTGTFLDDRRYIDDERYVNVWLALAQSYKDPTQLYEQMQKAKIGSKFAVFYIKYADFLEKRGNFQRASRVFGTGVLLEAQPITLLQSERILFKGRMKEWVEKMESQDEENDIKPLTTIKGFRSGSSSRESQGKARNTAKRQPGFAIFNDQAENSSPKHKQRRKESRSGSSQMRTVAGDGIRSSKVRAEKWIGGGKSITSEGDAIKENAGQMPTQWTVGAIPQRCLSGEKRSSSKKERSVKHQTKEKPYKDGNFRIFVDVDPKLGKSRRHVERTPNRKGAPREEKLMYDSASVGPCGEPDERSLEEVRAAFWLEHNTIDVPEDDDDDEKMEDDMDLEMEDDSEALEFTAPQPGLLTSSAVSTSTTGTVTMTAFDVDNLTIMQPGDDTVGVTALFGNLMHPKAGPAAKGGARGSGTMSASKRRQSFGVRPGMSLDRGDGSSNSASSEPDFGLNTPSPTINTKAAMQDVMGMFNSPSPDAEEEEEHDEGDEEQDEEGDTSHSLGAMPPPPPPGPASAVASGGGGVALGTPVSSAGPSLMTPSQQPGFAIFTDSDLQGGAKTGTPAFKTPQMPVNAFCGTGSTQRRPVRSSGRAVMSERKLRPRVTNREVVECELGGSTTLATPQIDSTCGITTVELPMSSTDQIPLASLGGGDGSSRAPAESCLHADDQQQAAEENVEEDQLGAASNTGSPLFSLSPSSSHGNNSMLQGESTKALSQSTSASFNMRPLAESTKPLSSNHSAELHASLSDLSDTCTDSLIDSPAVREPVDASATTVIDSTLDDVEGRDSYGDFTGTTSFV